MPKNAGGIKKLKMVATTEQSLTPVLDASDVTMGGV